MTDIPLRPLGVNFYGFFQAPQITGGTDSTYYQYENFDFNTVWKPQIDAAKAAGANLFVFFGDNAFYARGNITTNQYITSFLVIMRYLEKIGMYVLPYLVAAENDWGSTNSTDTATIIGSVCAAIAPFDNLIGVVARDEPFNGVTGGSVNGTISGRASAFYTAARANLPSDIGVCCAPNPGGNENPGDAVPGVFAYTGQAKTNLDTLAPYCDFFAFHPFTDGHTASDSSAIRAAYPTKDIIMPSSVLWEQSDNATTSAAKLAAIMALVGSNRFRGMAPFLGFDYPFGTDAASKYGFFNNDGTQRSPKIPDYQAGQIAPYVIRTAKQYYPGSPSLNHRLSLGYK